MSVSAPSSPTQRFTAAIKNMARALYQRSDSRKEIVAQLETAFPDANVPTALRIANWAREEHWPNDIIEVIEREERERVRVFMASQEVRWWRPTRHVEPMGFGDAEWMR